jgi:hypothetical protein
MTDLSRRLRQVTDWAALDRLLPALGRAREAEATAVAEALLRLVRTPAGLSIHPGVLSRVPLRLSHPGWRAVAEALAAHARARGDLPGILAAVLALRIARGGAAALGWLLAEPPGPAEQDMALHDALWRFGLLGGGVEAGWAAAVPPAAQLRALILLGLAARRPIAHAQAVVERLALPWLHAAAARGDAEAALCLEGLLTTYWLPREESEAHYGRWAGGWTPALHALGRAAAAPPVAAMPPPGPPRLAFIVHNGVLLAHTEVLLLALQALRRRGDAGFVPVVWVLGDIDPRFRAAFAAAGAELHALGEDCAGLGLAARLHYLRDALAAGGCGAAIWLCHPHMLAYAAGMRLAPRLAWWSLKYHPPVPGPALRLCQAGGAPLAPVEIRGQTWRILPLAFAAAAPDAAARAEAAALRAGLPAGSVVLSTVMRTDKLDSPRFWETVAEILRRAPQAIWRYAGREDLPGLRACLERHGVGGRAVFAGWVDPAVEAALADLYLDGWPVGSGAAAAQAMMAGTPYVFRAAEAEMDGSTGVMDTLWLLPHRRGVLAEGAEARFRAPFATPEGSLLRIPHSAAEQVDWALALIGDAGLRRHTGAAWARFAQESVCDPQGLAEGLRQAAALLLEQVYAKNTCGLEPVAG